MTNEHTRLRMREWYEKNREARLAYSRDYRARNKEKVASDMSQWRAKNKEYIKQSNKAYKEKHKSRLKVLRSTPEFIARKKVYDKTNVDMLNNQKRKHFYIKKYGLSIADYEDLLVAQNYRCAICDKHQSELDRNFTVDHDHVTNKVRGLLCASCNSGIGLLKDDYDLVLMAAAYLAVYAEIEEI